MHSIVEYRASENAILAKEKLPVEVTNLMLPQKKVIQQSIQQLIIPRRCWRFEFEYRSRVSRIRAELNLLNVMN